MLQVMLHKPSGLLGADEAEVVFGVLKQYADYGGLWGMLDPSVMEQQGRSVSHYLTGTDVLHACMHACMHARMLMHVSDAVSQATACAPSCSPCHSATATPSQQSLRGWYFVMVSGRAPPSNPLQAGRSGESASAAYTPLRSVCIIFYF